MGAEHYRTPPDGGEVGILFKKIARIPEMGRNIISFANAIFRPEQEAGDVAMQKSVVLERIEL